MKNMKKEAQTGGYYCPVPLIDSAMFPTAERTSLLKTAVPSLPLLPNHNLIVASPIANEFEEHWVGRGLLYELLWDSSFSEQEDEHEAQQLPCQLVETERHATEDIDQGSYGQELKKKNPT